MTASQQEFLEEKRDEFLRIVKKWLERRDKDAFWRKSTEKIGSTKPKYVMRMIEELNDKMIEPSFDKINSIETSCCGSADYAHKFSIKCAYLYLEQLDDN